MEILYHNAMVEMVNRVLIALLLIADGDQESQLVERCQLILLLLLLKLKQIQSAEKMENNVETHLHAGPMNAAGVKKVPQLEIQTILST